jgi:hypothetical protein
MTTRDCLQMTMRVAFDLCLYVTHLEWCERRKWYEKPRWIQRFFYAPEGPKCNCGMEKTVAHYDNVVGGAACHLDFTKQMSR